MGGNTVGVGSILVGTSGWTYRDWRGRFYPQKLAQRERREQVEVLRRPVLSTTASGERVIPI